LEGTYKVVKVIAGNSYMVESGDIIGENMPRP